VLCVSWDREKLRERIRARMLARFEQGMVDEVKRLVSAGISQDRLAMFGMEYKHIGRHLAGAVDYEKMKDDLLQDIRQLAKRQETWFRGMERRGIKVHWVKEADEEEAMRVIGEYSF
jgi:tRNA dimethylallyltransferase